MTITTQSLTTQGQQPAGNDLSGAQRLNRAKRLNGLNAFSLEESDDPITKPIIQA